MRARFTAQQKFLEQNIAAWQSREQQTVQSLDRIAKRFEETATHCATRLQTACGEFQAATKEHHAAALKVQNWVSRVALANRLWPCVVGGTGGALLGLIAAHFLKS